MSEQKVPKCPTCGEVDRMEHFPKLDTKLRYARHNADGSLMRDANNGTVFTAAYDGGEESRWYCDRCRRWLSSYAPVSHLHPSRYEGG